MHFFWLKCSNRFGTTVGGNGNRTWTALWDGLLAKTYNRMVFDGKKKKTPPENGDIYYIIHSIFTRFRFSNRRRFSCYSDAKSIVLFYRPRLSFFFFTLNDTLISTSVAPVILSHFQFGVFLMFGGYLMFAIIYADESVIS